MAIRSYLSVLHLRSVVSLTVLLVLTVGGLFAWFVLPWWATLGLNLVIAALMPTRTQLLTGKRNTERRTHTEDPQERASS